MLRKLVGLVGLSSLLIAAPLGAAGAADMPVKAPPLPPAPAFSWTGCYIGGDVGAGWVRDSDNEIINSTGTASPFSPAPTNIANSSGAMAGGYAGCDYQFAGGFVIGAVGDVQWASIRGGSAQYPNSGNPAFLAVTPAGTFVGGNSGVNDFYQTSANFEGSVRARIGYAFDRWLVYATGGIAWLRVDEHDVTESVIASQGLATDYSSTRAGWTLGAGADYAITNNWIARAEYRYSDFGTFSYTTPLFPAFNENHRITENQVLFGIHYKFGASPVVARY
ncbi:MAG TPA: outer membrane beta-barrel protein [Xanthobacteraceae bacterium]|nr:outer membrane beta-barrel protein [Xanthobacteraceae bacterium]